MLDVEKAKKELAEKTLSQIQRDTAWTWASRAVASFENVLDAENEKKVSLFICGQEYYHEAIEHASLVDEAEPDFVLEIKLAIMESLAEAIGNLDVCLDIDI